MTLRVPNGEKFHFYGKKDGKAVIWQRPYEHAAEVPDAEYPYWLCTGRVVEHWHTGSMTRRIPVLHKAMPNGYVELNPDDAKRMQIKTGDNVKINYSSWRNCFTSIGKPTRNTCSNASICSFL